MLTPERHETGEAAASVEFTRLLFLSFSRRHEMTVCTMDMKRTHRMEAVFGSYSVEWEV